MSRPFVYHNDCPTSLLYHHHHYERPTPISCSMHYSSMCNPVEAGLYERSSTRARRVANLARSHRDSSPDVPACFGVRDSDPSNSRVTVSYPRSLQLPIHFASLTDIFRLRMIPNDAPRGMLPPSSFSAFSSFYSISRYFFFLLGDNDRLISI